MHLIYQILGGNLSNAWRLRLVLRAQTSHNLHLVWGRPRWMEATMLGRDWLRKAATISLSLTLLAVAALAAAALAQEKPLEIGVLALGPRPVPEWRCGPESYRLASAERRTETK